MRFSQSTSWKRQVVALLLFGTAFGYLEAAVVSYLRYLHEPVLRRWYPTRPAGDLFPLLTPKQAEAAGLQERKVRTTEMGREAATIIMLAAVALAGSTNVSQWAARLVVAFGAWDITFYLFLKVLLGWPGSLFTWDILFIIPVPWVAPVAAPVLVSAVMILAGVWHLWSEATAKPVRLALGNWLSIGIGAGVIILSFTLDQENVRAGGMPHSFPWFVFGIGLATGLLGYAGAARKAEQREQHSATALAV